MTDTIIQVEGLSKRYSLGQQKDGARYRTLREGVTDALRAPFRRRPAPTGDQPTDFWALRDVNFEVRRGEVVGIIGRNGAGKSTLLKVLSRITEPTEGRIRIGGRVASLLEVGTGFHPELTGRENIFLNGAILGMHRAEIKAKFDEIVAFAEVERFLDTPVKRYSSGMYVRLAFAVAAHLEPEILIVDEVLAVGDVQFQQKCLGKMRSISQQGGRTVLFVSHNMGAVRALCSSGILMKNGQLALHADVSSTVGEYLISSKNQGACVVWPPENPPSAAYIRFIRAYVLNGHDDEAVDLDCTEPFAFAVKYEVLRATPNLLIGFFMQTVEGVIMCGSNDEELSHGVTVQPGTYVTRCDFPAHVLNAGTFLIGFGSDVPGYDDPAVRTEACLMFRVVDHQGHGPGSVPLPGLVRPRLKWSGKRD